MDPRIKEILDDAMGEGVDPREVLKQTVMSGVAGLTELDGVSPTVAFLSDLIKRIHQSAAKFCFPQSTEVN